MPQDLSVPAVHVQAKQARSLVNRSDLRKVKASAGLVSKKPRFRQRGRATSSRRMEATEESTGALASAGEPQHSPQPPHPQPPRPCSPLTPPPHLQNLRVRSRSEPGRRDCELPGVPDPLNRPHLPTQEHPSPCTGTPGSGRPRERAVGIQGVVDTASQFSVI